MKSAIKDPDQNTEIVPATTAELRRADYPKWLDSFDHQIQAVVELARQGNQVAFQLVCDLQGRYMSRSDEASAVASILERITEPTP